MEKWKQGKMTDDGNKYLLSLLCDRHCAAVFSDT